MTTRRWVEVSFAFFIVISLTRIAGAVVITPCVGATCPTTSVSVGNVLVGSSGTNSTLYLTSDTQNYNVDLAISGCTTANGTFTATIGGGSMNVQLKSTQNNVVDVTYMPTARGPQTCTVNVYTAGTTTGPLTSFTITGAGVAPVVSAPASVTFATPVRYNDAAAVHTATMNLTISNTGDTSQVLTVNNISLTGANWGGTQIISAAPALPATINPGSNATWVITFDPIAAGASPATVTIDSNDPVTPSKTVPVSGTGGTGVISVTTPLNFGTVNQGSTSTAQNIVVSNVGMGTKATLTVTGATFVNNTAGWFKFGNVGACNGSTTTCALSLALIANTGTVPVVCAPPANASGTQTASITFTSDADDSTLNTTSVSCTAGRADIMVTTTPLDFGTQLINTTSAGQTVMIANVGNATLNYSVALAGTNPGQFTLAGAGGCTSNCAVSAGSSVMVTVYFSPNNVGAKSALLRVTPINDPDTLTPIDVTLTGTCISPTASVNPTSMAFGNIDVGATATAQMLTLTNTGTSTLTISAAYLQLGAADYVTTGTTGSAVTISVPPSGTATWTIACKPSAAGARNGTFRITSDSGNVAGTNTDVPLTCNGLKGNLVIAVTPYDFGGVREGTMVSQTFTLTNNGNSTVSNINYSTSGTGTGYSILSPTFPYASLTAGASVTVTVQFYPLTGNDGGPYAYTFTGTWGGNNTPTSTTLNLNGDGLTTGFDTYPSYPNPLDFGDVRFDQTKNMPVSAINTAGTAYKIMSLTITPGPTTMSGEFAVVSCTHNGSPAVATGNGCPTTTVPFNSSGVNDTMSVMVQCNPNNRVAMLDGTLTITSDLPMNPTRTVPLKCNSTTAVLAVNPGNVVDFGPSDLDAVPVAVTKTVTLTNTGTAIMNIGTVTKTASGVFAFTATPTANVAPAGTYTFDVTYTPTTERPSNQPDTATVTIPLTGVFGTPGSATVTVSGYGVDRHIALAPAPMFPDTFKNPGTKAPVMPVTITNNGDATLSVSAVTLTDDPIWTIENPDPVDVAGRQTYDFNVKFSPITIGKAPTGHMVIINNDNGLPMASIDLNGNCVDRQVAFGPPVIDLGYVGIGIEAKLSDTSNGTTLLDVVNNDDINPFQITRIGLDGGNGAFQVIDSDGKPPERLDLSPRTTRAFDVTFTPNFEGDFQANASLYLDGADEPHATVVLRGRGLYVDVRGGGGCSTGRSGGGAMILVIGAMLLGGRRRRRHVAGVVGTLGVLIGARATQAETRNLDTTLFDPTPSTQGLTFQAQSADVGNDGDYAVTALMAYANDALVLDTAQNDYTAVQNRMMLNVGGAYAFGKRFEAGARVPFYFQGGQTRGDPTMMFGVVPVDTSVRGDATLHAKMHAGATEAVGGDLSYGFGGALTLPTRSGGEFAGTNMPQARLLVLATLTRDRLVTSLNAGGIIRSKERYSSLVQRSGATFSVGASYRLLDQLWLGGEVFGNLIPGGKTGQPAMGEAYGAPELSTSIEGLAEMRYQIARTSSLGVALGRGINSGVGTSSLRGVLMFAYTPGAIALKPLERPHGPATPKDADEDGIKDSADACPNEPEDKDMFDDGDGCPDNDNDNDGFPDAKDKCPLDPEDKDHFQDDDGCPEKDNDNDGVADDQDKCPIAAEDKDGFQDMDGCPDPDNDGDGIVDSADKCPREAETINGNNDDDGCPDKGDALVVLSPDRLELMESIQFEGGGAKIARASKNVLGQIGATLRAHPEIVRVRLTAHVQPTSNATRDQKLSEDRAKAVREWLVDWGLDPLRMQSSGFGGTKPLVPPTQRGAQQINDRFELIILERK